MKEKDFVAGISSYIASLREKGRFSTAKSYRLGLLDRSRTFVANKSL